MDPGSGVRVLRERDRPHRARDDARDREGSAFDLRAWHTKALRLGAIGLEQLGAELARFPADDRGAEMLHTMALTRNG